MQKLVNGKIKRRESNKLYVELFGKSYRIGECYDIMFQVNRMNYQLQHFALQLIVHNRLFPILINNPSYHSQNLHSVPCQSDNLQCTTNNPNELNAEQIKAIECIVSGKYNPVPNLLYGPPGKFSCLGTKLPN